jgi:predicted permease
MVPVSQGFFATTALPVLQGREFSISDTASSPKVIVINERMKARLWPSSDPVGQTFVAMGTTFTVVGIARDTKYRSLREEPRMTMYMPLAQSYEAAVTLVARSALPREATVAGLREAVRSVDPAMPLYNVQTMTEHVDQSLYLDLLRAQLISWLAGLALALAAVGLYGVVAYDVTQRTREVGIRLALGAQPGEVVRMLLGHGTKLAVAGLVVGAGLSFWLTRSVANLLYGITPYDPVAMASAAIVLLGVALAATYLPARRATRIDAVVALRQS